MINILLMFFLIVSSYSVKASKPYTKQLQEIWHIECQLGIIRDPDCPVDGGWSAWSAWSACRGPCDSIGFKVRTRQCNNPPPSKDGTPCTDNEEETVSCHLLDCTVEDFILLSSGDGPRMEAFQQLEVLPALMDQCLATDCSYQAIQTALTYDNTWGLNPEVVWNSLQCVKQNLGCRVPGEWGDWGEWSSCNARCGQGMRNRLRRCDSPPPSDEKYKCTGKPLESEQCEGDQCAIEKHVLYNAGGMWGEWQPWSLCSETCGPGARRRKRICEERTTHEFFTSWGTNCQGQHDEIQVCENNKCVLDGGWSGWGFWGPCSRTCGVGWRSRHRSCTRPSPVGGGAPCIGPKTEVESCYQSPCLVYSHVVAVLNGDSYLNYNFNKKRSIFFHFFMRFMSLSPYGTLVRRGDERDPLVRLSLQKWRVCVEASGLSKSCSLARLCSPSAIEPATWHNALVTITNNEATLRLDDAYNSLRSTFTCYPELPNDNINIFIGEKFHGEIQEIIMNFIPLGMISPEKALRSDFFPVLIYNIIFEEGDVEEGFLNIDADHYLRLPCFKDPAEWRLELTVKPKRDSGTLLFLRDEDHKSWLHLYLYNMRMKLQLGFDGFRTESSGSIDYFPGEWLDVIMSKKRHSSSVETSINALEHIYIVLKKEFSTKKVRKCNILSFLKKQPTSLISKIANSSDQSFDSVNLPICSDEFFVGNIPKEYSSDIEDSISFSGVIGMIAINGVMQDLHKLSLETWRNGGVQLSSRTASVSGSYHEIAWGFSNRLNLTCLHTRSNLFPATARWLFLDTVVHNFISAKTARSVDNGTILRLEAAADNDLRLMRGFYTCRSHRKRITRNIVTYAVLGKIPETLSAPDTVTAIALITTITLIISTLSWIFVEALRDIQNGHGFFRNREMTPQEEAEVVCKYIDNHMDLVCSKSMAWMAKARARRKAKQLTDKINAGVQEPKVSINDLMEPPCPSCLELKLPAIENNKQVTPHMYRCEPCYVSSPRHGSNLSPKLLTSSSDMNSSKVRSTRFPMSKGLRSRQKKQTLRSMKQNSDLLTIKSSTFVNQSIALKILDRFRELKSYDS